MTKMHSASGRYDAPVVFRKASEVCSINFYMLLSLTASHGVCRSPLDPCCLKRVREAVALMRFYSLSHIFCRTASKWLSTITLVTGD